ncbi:1-deoxy-D-xylulose-5-phosphate synthase, partial [Dysosmobacter welbionis]
GVGPSGTMAFLVGAIGRGGSRTAPDGGAAGGVGDVHPVTEQLGNQAGIAGLGAAGAGAGELQHGLTELAALDGVVLHVLLLGHLGDAVVEDLLLGGLLLLVHHGQGVHRALAHAHGAAHAVQRADGHGVLVHALALAGLHVHDLGGGGGILGLLLRQSEGTDGGVGADIGAVVALDALGGIPSGNGHGHAALLIGGGAQLELAVHMLDEGGHGQAVAVHAAHGVQNRADLLHQSGGALVLDGLGLVHSVGPVGGHIELLVGGGAGVDGLVVHVHDVLALLQVGVGGGVLHVAHSLALRHDLSQREEGGLQDGVGALAHADFLGQVDGVDGVDLNVVLGDVALGGGIQMVAQLLVAPLAVDQEHTAGLHVPDNGEVLGDVGGHVAGHEVGLVDVVGRLDGGVAEAQVADGDAAGLLGVVLEVRLDILVGMVADDLDGVLVGAHGAVAAQAPELALNRTGGSHAGSGLLLQAQVGHIVHDADGELALHGILLQLVIHGEDGGGRGVLAAQAVTAADHLDVGPAGVGQSSDHVHVQGLALGAGLLGAVQHGDLLAGGGDGGEQLVRTPGPVQPDLDEAHLLAARIQIVDDLLSHVADGAHGDDDAVCVGSAVVVEQLIVG